MTVNRFVVTRMWFMLSVGGGASDWMRGLVTNVEPIVSGEIWRITVQHPASQESFYVLESTCEVIGRPTASSDSGLDTVQTAPLRADWSAYIAQPHGAPLMDRLKWTNHEEYDKGISKVWLQRISRENDVGAAKKLVAERYVMACVVSNRLATL